MGPGGFVIDYLYSQRWFALKEKVGMTFYVVDEKFHQYCIERMFSYDWRFAWDKLLAVANGIFVKEILNRRCLSLISKEEANEYFDEYIGYLDIYEEIINTHQKGVVRYNLVRMLGRLCAVVTEDRVMRYVKILIKFDVRTVSEILCFIYDFLPAEKISLLMPTVLEKFDVKTPYDSGIPLPSNRNNLYFPVDSSLLAKVCDGFSSKELKDRVKPILFACSYGKIKL